MVDQTAGRMTPQYTSRTIRTATASTIGAWLAATMTLPPVRTALVGRQRCLAATSGIVAGQNPVLDGHEDLRFVGEVPQG